MRNIFLIARKELKHFFISPIAYIIAFVILAYIGGNFYLNLVYAMNTQTPPTVANVIAYPMVFLLFISTPAITMRSLADEQKSGTLEVLLTAPVRDWEVIIGKWLGGMYFILIVFAVTLIYPIVLNSIVSPGIDQGLMITSYLGLVLLSGSFLAIGVLTSSLFSNQIAAYFSTLGILLILLLLGSAAQLVSSGGGGLLSYLAILDHYYNSFPTGLLELKDVIYYLSIIVLALSLGSISVETRRWR